MRFPIRLSTAAAVVVSTTMSAVVVAGFAVTRTGPGQFPDLGVGLSWAATITTVGYGDVVPSSPEGRAVRAVLMFAGIACLALLTAIAASAIVTVGVRSEEAVIERDQESILDVLRDLDRRLAGMERALRDLTGAANRSATTLLAEARGRATTGSERAPSSAPVRRREGARQP